MQSRRIAKLMQQKSHQQDAYALPAISSCKERGFSERDHPIRRTSPFTCEVMHLHFAHNVSISSPSPSPSTVKGESRNNEIRHKYARTRAMENPCHFQNERILPLYGYCPWMERLSAGWKPNEAHSPGKRSGALGLGVPLGLQPALVIVKKKWFENQPNGIWNMIGHLHYLVLRA